jgi:hypothetical protein
MVVDLELEVVWIPVSDVDRAKRFYLEQAGFGLLADIPNGLQMVMADAVMRRGVRVCTTRPASSAALIRSGKGIVGTTPPASRRDRAG